MNRLYLILLVGAGALQVLGHAPFSFWPAPVLALAVFCALLVPNIRESALRGFCFGLGLFGFGCSWPYVSILNYGTGEPFSAAAAVAGLVAIQALCPAGAAATYAWMNGTRQTPASPMVFASCWVLWEWVRSWLLSGFPWLEAGYSQVGGLLGGWMPVIGSVGVSWLLALTAGLTGCWFAMRALSRAGLGASIVLIWVAGPLLALVEWTKPTGELRAALVQPATPIEMKWQRARAFDNLIELLLMSDPYWDADLVVWPEAAVTLFWQEAAPLLNGHLQSLRPGAALVTGVPHRAEHGYSYNALAAAGAASGLYFKRKLVPFGEYVPFESAIGDLLGMFNAPRPRSIPGPARQQGLLLNGQPIATSICYEIAWPESLRRESREAGVILTVSNDAWFGNSFGPSQHLELARVRARENGRAMLRANNNGISALIDADGRIITSLGLDKAGVISGTVALRSGWTPWQRLGYIPVILLGLLSLLLATTRMLERD